MDKRDIKDSVIDGYGKIARHSDGGILSKLSKPINKALNHDKVRQIQLLQSN